MFAYTYIHLILSKSQNLLPPRWRKFILVPEKGLGVGGGWIDLVDFSAISPREITSNLLSEVPGPFRNVQILTQQK